MAIGLAWSLCADRPRGRLRCPRCWYAIDLPTRTECPECGRAFANERQLQRTRRHPWRSGFFALLLVGAIYGTTCVESIRRDGWLGVVPTIALVAVTDGEEAWKWQRGTPPSRATEVLLDRMAEHRSSLWSRRLWSRKAAEAMPPLQPTTAFPSYVVVYDLSRFAPLEPLSLSGSSFVSGIKTPVPVMNDASGHEVLDIVTSTYRPWTWRSIGGEEANCVLIGDQLIVRASRDHLDEIWDVMLMLNDGPRGVGEELFLGLSETPVVWYDTSELLPKGDDVGSFEDARDSLYFELQEQNRKALWAAYGGNDATLFRFRDGFVIAATPDHHKEIAAFIDAKAATVKSSD